MSVVCTGFGVVSPLGCDVASFADRMFAGASAVSATTRAFLPFVTSAGIRM